MEIVIYMKRENGVPILPITNLLTVVEPENCTENHIWETAYGQEIPVREMETSHINNTIRCWEGKGKKKIPHGYLGGKAKWLKIFNEELINRN